MKAFYQWLESDS